MRGLYGAKPWFTRKLNLFVSAAVRRGWSPDAFTVIGILFGGLAAVGLLSGLWPVTLLGLVGRLAGANLDGAVARARGVSRPFGFVLNEIGDRAGDLLPFAALLILASQSGSIPAFALTVVAAITASWPTFISLAVAGAGGPRQNGGPFGKTERSLTLALASIALAVIPDHAATLSVIAVIVAFGSTVTAVTRVLSGRRYFAGVAG